MRPTRTTLVLEVTTAAPSPTRERHVELLGQRFRLRQVTPEELPRWVGRAAAVAVSGAPWSAVADLVDETPTTDGHRLLEVLQEWAVREVHAEMPGYFSNARTVVLGPGHDRVVRVLREHTDNIEFADAGRRYADVGGLPLRLLPRLVPGPVRGPAAAPVQALSHALAGRAARESDVVVATYEELAGFGLEDLAGKAVITSAVSGERLTELGRRGVDLVVDVTPQPFTHTVTTAALEALLLAHSDVEVLGDGDLLDLIVTAGLEPRLLHPNGPRRKSRFAFVIHPLSQEYFRKVEPLRTVGDHTPGLVMNAVEKAVAYLPPFTYSHVTGIRSPTGAEAEGWLITVGGTPRELMAHSPEFTYARLLQAAETARKLGAQIMGLGAFTKVVGDAGVTVARQAPLPVTTGNSYSASGALWAAHEALLQLGIAPLDGEGRLTGNAMVVGATGAIGSVCARLLALASAELWLVSPETAKLLALKHLIEEERPGAVVHVATSPDEALPQMDLVVTATSGAGKRVLDIMAVKPGCVITDVARPLDLSPEDVARRPDVLVVESGEIELPGEVRMKDIGLPQNVVYACLAETVVLALEGRYEPFTVGRNIEWARVKEIYQLGLKHGMKLATISGVEGVHTPEKIAQVRELALAARQDAGS